MPRSDQIQIGQRRYRFQTRQILLGASSAISVPKSTAQQSIQQSEGPTPIAQPNGAIRIRNIWVSLADANSVVSLLDASLTIQLAGSSSGPYVNVAAFSIDRISAQTISTQGQSWGFNLQEGQADFIGSDWTPVQPGNAPFWQSEFNIDVANASGSVDGALVVTTSILWEDWILTEAWK